MLETTTLLITEMKRNLVTKLKASPVLYFFFSIMMVGSVVMFSVLTLFLLHTETKVELGDLFLGVFFVFMLKSAADMHTFFIAAPQVSYALSTQIKQTKTVAELFFSLFLMNLVIWFSFSGLYLLAAYALGININYPMEYCLFSIGVIIASLLGCCLALHFFSSQRYRLLPTLILLGFYGLSKEMLFVACTLPLALLHCFWSLTHASASYRFVNRKERSKERTQVKTESPIGALFYRETTVLWRERLLISFIFMSISTALGTGYLILYGTDLLIPEPMRQQLIPFLPSMFVFVGVYVVVIYTSAFPALNLFLTEEKTLWILRNAPIKNETIVYGKVSALALCFVASIPFIAYMSPFISFETILFLSWFLVFSFIAGIIVSVPLGAKYVGKKSDILLLYSVAMILFAILGIAATAGIFLRRYGSYEIPLYVLIILMELGVLWGSLKLSARILAFKPSVR